METARLSYTSVNDYMAMSIMDFYLFRRALGSVLERERDASKGEE